MENKSKDLTRKSGDDTIRDTTPGKETRDKEDRKSILGNADSGTAKNHAAQPMCGNLGKKGEGLADMEAAAGNTDD